MAWRRYAPRIGPTKQAIKANISSRPSSLAAASCAAFRGFSALPLACRGFSVGMASEEGLALPTTSSSSSLSSSVIVLL